MSKSKLTLELGDIIMINAPNNPEINSAIFLIDYIDTEKRIDLIHTNTLNKKSLTFTSSVFDDKSIISIDILDRSKKIGYAAQNELNVGTWLDIFFGGDIPYSITGKITDKIEDMIEIQNYENNEKLYIDFEYKGIPDDIPINEINVRGAPTTELNSKLIENFINNEQSGLNTFDKMQLSPVPEFEEEEENTNSNLTDDNDIDELNVEISAADQIVYGAALDEIYYYVEVDKEEKLYSIDEQIQDLHDDLLATIPSNQRDYQTNIEVNQLLKRFKELRTKFSFEENGILKLRRLSDKPLINKLEDGVKWLIPVVKHNLNELSDDDWLRQYEEDIKRYETSNDSNNRYLELIGNLKENDLFKPNRSRPDNLTEYIPAHRKETFYVTENDSNQFLTTTYLPHEYGRHNSNEKTVYSEGDLLIPTSFMQTPFIHIDFTRTSLLQTDLLVKSIKPKINVWELLSYDDVHPNIIEMNEDILTRNEISAKYYNNFTHHLILNSYYDNDGDGRNGNADVFTKMMNTIIPKTSDIIKIISPYYRNIYNVQVFIEQLHLFKIDEINHSNHKNILKSITANIKAYNDNKKFSMSSIKILATTKYETNFKKQTLDILLQSIKSQIGEITTAYGIKNMTTLSNVEIFNEIMKQDNYYLLSIVISNLNAGLLITNNVNDIIEEHKLQLKSKYITESDAKNKKCADYVIAKRYNSQDALNDDNSGLVAYYDIEYDTTPYVLKDDYYTEISALTDEESVVFIKKKLIENLNMNESTASNTAKIIVDGKKPIGDGVYAILDIVDDETQKLKRTYFIRNENMWVSTDMDDPNFFVSNNKDICNLQSDCLTTNNGCISTDNASNQIENNFIDELMNDFNITDIAVTKEALQNKFNDQYRKQLKIIVRLREINHSKTLIHDRIQKMIGMTIDDNEPILSPYARLLDKILGQYDFKKKTDDIIKFYESFCRVPTEDEDQYWYYCKLTHVKLMPTFMKILASSVENGDYVNEVNRICAGQGGLSDDGNAWIDKHSGYKIKDIEYSEEEGFDDTGFKAISRALLEADVGDDILRDVIDTNDIRSEAYNEQRNSPLQKVVHNIIKTMLSHMGIDYDTSIIEVDIQNTLLKLIGEDTKDIETPKIGKAIIYVTLSYLLIVVQTAIPPIKTNKTFPGCTKSFSGYPYDGSADKSGLEYIACVALGIKSSIFPWHTLRKIKKNELVEKLQTTIIPKYLMNEFKIRDMIANKKKFMKTFKDVNQSKIYDLDNWATFLPHLKQVSITANISIGRGFETELVADIKTGKRHNEKLDLIKNKVYFTSVSIQNKINSIVKSQTPLVVSMSNIPFIENACCNENYKTISYFVNKNKEINDISIRNMMNIYHKYNGLSKASILYDPIDTRKIPINEFPGYSEELIYRTFMGHCKYNSQQEPPELVKSVCQRRPDNYKTTDSISNKIRNLKNNGVQYTEQHFNELLNILNKQNSINPLQQPGNTFNEKEYLHELIAQFEDFEVDVTANEYKIFIQNIKNYINGKSTQEKITRDLVTRIDQLKNIIMKELKKCNKHKTAQHVFDYVLSDAVHHESYVTSIKNVILNITNILPNMILNKTTFEEGVNIPRHWNVSDKHSIDLKNIIEKQNNIKSYFDNETIKQMSYKIATVHYLITDFAKCIYNSNGFDDELKEKMLQFTLLFILKQFLTITIDGATDITSSVKSIGNTNNNDMMEGFSGEEMDFISELQNDDGDSRRKLLGDVITICDNELKHALLSYDDLLKKVNKSKIIEKDNITQFLNALTIEEREIENLFKNNKLEKWSVGLQKGIRIYDKETYDRETDNLNQIAVLEEDRLEQEINADNELNVVDDDDHGDLDGDEEY
jgi:hypothetical protein